MKFTLRDLIWATLVAALLLVIAINMFAFRATKQELDKQIQLARTEAEVARVQAQRARAIEELVASKLLNQNKRSTDGEATSALPSVNKPNQVQPLESPSGQFTATVPIRIGNARPNVQVWILTIENDAGELVYEDLSSQFVGHLNVYWTWDDDDRFWLYNSDDGCTWYWQNQENGWIKTLWSDGLGRKTGDDFEPPRTLAPHYSRRR